MRRTLLALLLIAVVGLVGFYPWRRAICDGGIVLEVRVESRSGRPIATVMAEACQHSREAEQTIEDLASRKAKVVQSPYRGESLSVHIEFSETLNEALFWGYQSRYAQFSKSLAVVVEYQGGERRAQVVEIPDLRQSRTLLVLFP